ncbi:hypothetical protein MBLNU457_g2814t1 [Dothideomycetes sp. NU457]
MPVSHIGLTVENLPASTSFFQSALQPLGYRYVGTRNDQIGFGVKEADFFLGPIPDYSKPSPIHVAFTAPSRNAIRDFYIAALEAGGTPAGSPAYRGENHDIFNAAVLDLDGNTIEVVHHRGHCESASTISQRSTRLASTPKPQSQIRREEYREVDFDKEATDSAIDITRAIPSIRRPSLPSQLDGQPGKAPTNSVLGTMIGAAAGAAAIYAFYSMERDSAREEEAFNMHILRRHSSTDARPERSHFRSVYTLNSKDYRRHSEPAVDTSYTRPSQQKHVKHDRPSEKPLFRRSFTSNAPPSHHSQTSRRNKTHNTGINTIAETPEQPDPSPPKQGSTISTTSRLSRGHHRDNPDRSQRFLEWRSPSRRPRSSGQNRISIRHASPPRHSRNDDPANRPLPSSRVGSRYSAPLSYISAALGKDIASGRHDDGETVLPEDSISCVDFTARRRRESGHSRRERGDDRDRDRDRDRGRDKHRDRDRDDGSQRTIHMMTDTTDMMTNTTFMTTETTDMTDTRDTTEMADSTDTIHMTDTSFATGQPDDRAQPHYRTDREKPRTSTIMRSGPGPEAGVEKEAKDVAVGGEMGRGV